MDDKTTKIPSLKEFQKAQQEQEKREKLRRTGKAPAKNNKSLKGDTHRVDLNRSGRKTSINEPEIKTREYVPKSKKTAPPVSGTTHKIDSKKVREQDDRFKAFESDVSYNRRPPKEESRPLTRTRVAGQRPQGQSPQPQRPPQRTHNQNLQNQRPPQRPQAGSRPPQPQQRRNPDAVPKKGSVNHRPKGAQPQVIHKKKKKPLSPLQRKVRKVLVYSLIVLAILVVGVILSMTVLFKTEKITVNVPDNFYSSQDIIDASGLHYQENIFMAGKSRAEDRLEEKFPYIKTAKVTAVIPDTINIDITLSTASYALRTDKITYIASEDSKVLDVIATADEVDVPLIEGVSVKDAKAGEHLEFESQIVKDSLNEMFNLAKEKGYKKITKVDIESNKTQSGTQTIEIRYVYDDRIVVYLGIPENISYKMQTAQTIITEKLDVNGAVLTGELDVSNAYDTKKSYFNQYSLIPEVVIPEPSATAATEPTTTVSEDYAADIVEDEYYDENYDDSEEYYAVEDVENIDEIEENPESDW